MKTKIIKIALLALMATGIQSQALAQLPARARAKAAANRAAAPQVRQMRSKIVGMQRGQTARIPASQRSVLRNPSNPRQTWTNTLGRIYSQDGRSFMNPTISTRSGQLQRGKVYQLKDGTKARYMGSDGYTSARGTPTYQFSRFQVVQSHGKQPQQSSRSQPSPKKPSSRSTSTHQPGLDIMISPETSEVKSATEGL